MDGYFVFRLPGSVVQQTIGSSLAAAGLGAGVSSAEGTNTFMFLPSAQSPTDYQFPIDHLPGQRFIERGDGGVDLIDSDGRVTQSIGAPWAIDAQGRKHQTWYTLEQTSPTTTTLTQHIRPDADAIYPVLADPVTSIVIPRPSPDPIQEPNMPNYPQAPPSSGSGYGGGGSSTGSGTGSGGSRGSSSGSSGGGGSGPGPVRIDPSEDGIPDDIELDKASPSDAWPGGAKLDDGSGPRKPPGSDDSGFDFMPGTAPITTPTPEGIPLFKFNPWTGASTVVGVNFNLWDTVGGIAKGIGRGIDAIGGLFKPGDKPTLPLPSPDLPKLPDPEKDFGQVLAGGAIAIVVIGGIAYVLMTPEQQAEARRQAAVAANNWWNNARDRIFGSSGSTGPSSTVKPADGGTITPKPTSPLTPPANPGHTIEDPTFGNHAPLVTTGPGTTVGTPATQPNTTNPTRPVVVPGETHPATAPGGPDDDPNNDDDDPDKDNDHQSYPAGGIIGAGLGGAPIEIPGLPHTPDTPPDAPKPPTFDPTPPPGTDPGTTADDPHKPDPNKTPDQTKPVETTPTPTTPTNPILGLAQGILNFFFPKPKTPEPTTPGETGPTTPGGTTPGTGTASGTPEDDKTEGSKGEGGKGDSTAAGAGKEEGTGGKSGSGTSSGNAGTENPFKGKTFDEITAELVEKLRGITAAEVEQKIAAGDHDLAALTAVEAAARYKQDKYAEAVQVWRDRIEAIAKDRGVKVEDLPRTQPYELHVTVDAPGPTGTDLEPQFNLQGIGANAQTVKETNANFDKERKSTSSVREGVLEELTDRVFKALRAAGFDRESADDLSQSLAKNLFSTQDMTHNPDMIFGGPDVVINFGDSSVNRSLGQVTKKESDAYRQWLSQQDPDALVNLKIVFTYTGTQQQGPKTSTRASA